MVANYNRAYKELNEIITLGNNSLKTDSYKGTNSSKNDASARMHDYWLSKTSTFVERYLKDHPLYNTLHTFIFQENVIPTNAQKILMSLLAVQNDEDYWKDKGVDFTDQGNKSVVLSNTDKANDAAIGYEVSEKHQEGINIMNGKLSKQSEKLLLDLIESDNPTQLLSDHFYDGNKCEDPEIMDAISELTEAKYIKVAWADDVPYIVQVTRLGREYKRQLSENNGQQMEKSNNKEKKLLISHSSDDKEYCEALVTLLEVIGMNESNMICSSIPGYGIPLDADIYQWLASQFNKIDLHVVFILSDNYYHSAACLNEMGATWILQDKYTSILLPGFEFKDIKGACNPNKISIKLDSDETELKQRLNELKDNLTNEFSLNKISDVRWERARDNFIKTIKNIKPQVREESKAENTVKLDNDECILLVYAAADLAGRITVINTISRTAPEVETNGYNFVDKDTAEEGARWTGAVEKLEMCGLVEAAGFKREVFKVTKSGFRTAKEIVAQYNIDTSKSPDEYLKGKSND